MDKKIFMDILFKDVSKIAYKIHSKRSTLEKINLFLDTAAEHPDPSYIFLFIFCTSYPTFELQMSERSILYPPFNTIFSLAKENIHKKSKFFSCSELTAFFLSLCDLSGPRSKLKKKEEILQKVSAMNTFEERYFFLTICIGKSLSGLSYGFLPIVIYFFLNSFEKVSLKPKDVLLLQQIKSELLNSKNLFTFFKKIDFKNKKYFFANKISVFTPVRSMLVSLKPKKNERTKYFLEDKLDGIRIQVHIRGGKYMLFSRSMNEITPQYPELKSKLVINSPLSAIFDGELVPLSNETNKPVSFSKLSVRFGLKNFSTIADKINMKIYVYDLLMVDEVSLLDEPLIQRKKKLKEVLYALNSDVLLEHEYKEIELASFEQINLKENMEGVVLKKINSKYFPGERTRNWIKLKKDMVDIKTLDLPIMSLIFKRTIKEERELGALQLGIVDNNEIIKFCKVGSGIGSKKLQRWLQKKVGALNESIHGSTIDVLSLGLTCETIYSEVMKNKLNSFSLRFPRIQAVRDDKPHSECETIQNVKQIYSIQQKKVFK